MVAHEIDVTSAVVNDTYVHRQRNGGKNKRNRRRIHGRTERVMELKATQNVDHDYWLWADWDERGDCRRQHNARK